MSHWLLSFKLTAIDHELFVRVEAQLSALFGNQADQVIEYCKCQGETYVTINVMFNTLATKRSQGHRSVVRRILSVTFLEYWTHNCFLPICWYNILV